MCHDTVGKAVAEGVIGSLPPKGSVKVICGLPLTRHGLPLGTRTHTRRDGVVEQREVSADTTFRGLAGKSLAWEGHIDYTVVDPRAKTYRERAAVVPLHAAKLGYRRKELLYGAAGLLRPNQEMFIMCFELFGGVDERSWEQLMAWASEYAPQGPGQRGAAGQMLLAWRQLLSRALLTARVGAMHAAKDKLRGRAVATAGAGAEDKRRVEVIDLREKASVRWDYAMRAQADRGFRRLLAAM